MANKKLEILLCGYIKRSKERKNEESVLNIGTAHTTIFSHMECYDCSGEEENEDGCKNYYPGTRIKRR